MSAADIIAELDDRWRGDPILPLCVKMIDYISALPADQLKMLTFNTLCRAGGKTRVDQELLQAVAILANSRVAALDSHALLVDEDGTEYELLPEQLAEARATGLLIHPETGEPVPEYETKVIPFFVPSARFTAGGE